MLDSWKMVGKGEEALGNPILARVRGGAAEIACSGVNGEWQVSPALSEIYLHSKVGRVSTVIKALWVLFF
jgi:hypothetical protein